MCPLAIRIWPNGPSINHELALFSHLTSFFFFFFFVAFSPPGILKYFVFSRIIQVLALLARVNQWVSLRPTWVVGMPCHFHLLGDPMADVDCYELASPQFCRISYRLGASGGCHFSHEISEFSAFKKLVSRPLFKTSLWPTRIWAMGFSTFASAYQRFWLVDLW